MHHQCTGRPENIQDPESQILWRHRDTGGLALLVVVIGGIVHGASAEQGLVGILVDEAVLAC